jgi:hypothetical protein
MSDYLTTGTRTEYKHLIATAIRAMLKKERLFAVGSCRHMRTSDAPSKYDRKPTMKVAVTGFEPIDTSGATECVIRVEYGQKANLSTIKEVGERAREANLLMADALAGKRIPLPFCTTTKIFAHGYRVNRTLTWRKIFKQYVVSREFMVYLMPNKRWNIAVKSKEKS